MGKYDAMTFSYDERQGPAPLFAVFHFIRWGKHQALQDNVTILTFQTIYFLLDLSSSSWGKYLALQNNATRPVTVLNELMHLDPL